MQVQSPPTAAASPSPQPGTVDFERTLNAEVLQSLFPVSLVLAGLYTFYTLSHLREGMPYSGWLAVIAVTNVVAFLILALLLRRQRLPARYAHPISMALTCGMLIHRFSDIFFTGLPQHTTNLIILLIGVGYILLATPWLIAVIVLTLGGWGLLLLRAADPTLWLEYVIALGAATALSFIIHFTRRQALFRHERLLEQNTQRTYELEHQTLHLATLTEVSQNVNALLDLDVLLNHVTDLIQERFRYYYVGIFLVDESKSYMVSRAGSGKSGSALAEQNFKLRIDQGLIGQAASHHEVVCVNDVQLDTRYVKSVLVPDTRAELVLPLEIGGELLGILDIQSERLNAFSEVDTQVFKSLADQVAIAINNALLYQSEYSRRMLTEMLYEVSYALSRTLNLQEVLDLILGNLVQIVPFDRGSVMLCQEESIEIVAAFGFPVGSAPTKISFPITRGDIFDQLRELKKPLIITDVRGRPDFQQVKGLPEARAWMGVPLIDEAQAIIGMFSLTRETPTAYTEDETTLALSFAGQTAIALNNARLYSELANAYAQLERIDHTKTDFIAVASHELRTPLTVLLGFAQLLIKSPDLKDHAMHRPMLDNILKSGTRLKEIIDTMVDMARIDNRTLEIYADTLALSSSIKAAVAPLREALAERRLTLVIEPLEELPLLQGDRDELVKVFYQLLINAIKYTPDGGHISVAGTTFAAGYRDVATAGVEIIITDTGIGIDPQHHDLIFEKFYQTGQVALHSSGKTKFKGGGPGLGLTIAKGIVEAHGGQIWVESPGHDEEGCPGSRFHVALPLKPPATLALPNKATQNGGS